MRVLTLQGYDLRTFDGRIELNRGTYNDNEEIVDAQQRLYGLINEDQVVWCGQDEPCLLDQADRYLHDIDVDPREIVAVIDSLVWCHIIKYHSRYIPPEEHSGLRFHAATSGGNYDLALRQAEDDYLAANLPNDLWSGLTKTEVSKKSDQLLLRFPFRFSKIVNVDVVTEDVANRGRRTKKAR